MFKSFYVYQITGEPSKKVFGEKVELDSITVLSEQFPNDISPYLEVQQANEKIFGADKAVIELNENYFPIKTPNSQKAQDIFNIDEMIIDDEKMTTIALFTIEDKLFSKIITVSDEDRKEENNIPKINTEQKTQKLVIH